MVKPLRGTAAGMGFLAAALMLSGCGGLTQIQRETAKAKADYQNMRGAERERANYAACVDQGAMPGSAQNLACQLEMSRKEQEAAKAQSQPPNKSP